MQTLVGQGLENLINVFEVQKTPAEQYLKNYERVNKFVQRDLYDAIRESDQNELKYCFFDIMSRQGKELISRCVSRVDIFFSLAQLHDDQEKLPFGTAQTKVKRELDQNLRTFKEFVNLEENKKVAQSHVNKTMHQEARLMQEMASLMLTVHTYYLK